MAVACDAREDAWDQLREQDWNSLGGLGDESMTLEDKLWDGAGDRVVGHCAHPAGLDTLALSEAGTHKGTEEFSPMTLDAQFDCFWDNFPGQGLDSSCHEEVRSLSGTDQCSVALKPQAPQAVRPAAGMPNSIAAQEIRGSVAKTQRSPRSPSSPRASKVLMRSTASNDALAWVRQGTPAQVAKTLTTPHSGLGAGADVAAQHAGDDVLHELVQATGDSCHVIRHQGKDILVMQLLVVAITDAPLMPDIPNKLRADLDLVKRRLSKEEHVSLCLPASGDVVDLKLRVLPAAGAEAVAVNEYMAGHANQIPSPYVVLHSLLDMGIAFDAATADAAVLADRLRKKMKTHTVKVLRDGIMDSRCGVSAHCLRGQQGPVAAWQHLHFLAEEKMTPLENAVVVTVPGAVPEFRRLIVVPSKKPRAPKERGVPSAISGGGKAHAYAGLLQAHFNGVGGTCGPMSPEHSMPSTPRGHLEALDDDSGAGAVGRGGEQTLTAYFPVNLFVTAIADGQIAGDTAPKMAERLGLIVRKIPKEQNTSVEIADGGGSVPLQLRVFVVNSEDAKAVGEYVNSHMDQVPAPFVVLAWHLPMAVRYDPATLDLSDASVADRLRKQAKTRAVKVLRETIGNKSHGITMKMLRGHEGAAALELRLRDALGGLLRPVEEEAAGVAGAAHKYVVFAARNKTSSAPSSPRKRRSSGDASPIDMAAFPDDSPGDGLGGVRRGVFHQAPAPSPKGGSRARVGAASASHLHRNMLQQAYPLPLSCAGVDGRVDSLADGMPTGKRIKRGDFELSSYLDSDF